MEILKENLKWLILGVSLIIAVTIYTFGTRYVPVGSSGAYMDRFTGVTKAYWE